MGKCHQDLNGKDSSHAGIRLYDKPGDQTDVGCQERKCIAHCIPSCHNERQLKQHLKSLTTSDKKTVTRTLLPFCTQFDNILLNLKHAKVKEE